MDGKEGREIEERKEMSVCLAARISMLSKGEEGGECGL